MEKGDLIKLEYSGWITNGEDVLIDTTDEALAKENGIYKEGTKYGYMITIIGEGRLIEGLEEVLMETGINEEKEIVIPPEKAYGVRDNKQVKVHSLRELLKNEIEPRVGAEVVLNNRKGRIVSVTPGRVVIDYNNPLAGRTLKYSFKVVEKIEAPDEKVRAVIDMDYPREADFEVSLSDSTVTIKLPDVCKYDPNWAMSKFQILSDIRKYVGEEFTVVFVEEYPAKVQSEEEAEQPDEKAVPVESSKDEAEEKSTSDEEENSGAEQDESSDTEEKDDDSVEN